MTKKAYTYEILNGYCMNNDRVNTEYLADQIIATCDNDKSLYEMAKENKRMKTRNIAIQWTKFFVDLMLKYNGHRDYTCINQHLMDYDRKHGNDLEKVLDIVEEYIIELRNEE